MKRISLFDFIAIDCNTYNDSLDFIETKYKEFHKLLEPLQKDLN